MVTPGSHLVTDVIHTGICHIVTPVKHMAIDVILTGIVLIVTSAKHIATDAKHPLTFAEPPATNASPPGLFSGGCILLHTNILMEWNDLLAPGRKGRDSLSTPPYTRPAKPINASARIPAVTSAIGAPFIPDGTSASSSCSRIPARITSASPKPTAVAAPYTIPSTRL